MKTTRSTNAYTRPFLPQVVFCAGCVIVIGSSTWFYFQSIDTKLIIYAPTIFLGFGCSMMLVTSLAMVTELIGDDTVRIWKKTTFFSILAIILFYMCIRFLFNLFCIIKQFCSKYLLWWSKGINICLFFFFFFFPVSGIKRLCLCSHGFRRQSFPRSTRACITGKLSNKWRVRNLRKVVIKVNVRGLFLCLCLLLLTSISFLLQSNMCSLPTFSPRKFFRDSRHRSLTCISHRCPVVQKLCTHEVYAKGIWK